MLKRQKCVVDWSPLTATTVEPEVILCLPRGSDSAPELVPQATPMDPGAVMADADTPDPRQHHRFGPGAVPNQWSQELLARMQTHLIRESIIDSGP